MGMNDTDISEAKTRKLFIDKALIKAGWGPIVPFRVGAKCHNIGNPKLVL